MPTISLEIRSLRRLYQTGTMTPTRLVEWLSEEMERQPERNVWIYRMSREALLTRAREVEALGLDSHPLYGIPFAIKDNIDLAGVPTTAGCPAFAYIPERSATVVERLLAAGAIPVGKTNLDQFATGLVGTRSPFGACKNAFDPAYVSGGSSSGSAVAVATGQASFALGTDTAGSGRVPAAFNNLVGIKPTPGLVSTEGVVPACRTLDCVTAFTLTAADAEEVLRVMAGPDPQDAYSREPPAGWSLPANVMADGAPLRVGVPDTEQLSFFGDHEAQALFRKAVERVEALGGRVVPFDYAPFRETAALLYGGPWVAERYVAVASFLVEHPDDLDPTVRGIIKGAERYTAVDVYQALYRLESLRRVTEQAWDGMDVMLLPTTGTIYTIEQVNSDPVQLNTNLGYYTNFVNLLNLSALAVPSGLLSNGLPQGITLIAPAWHEMLLLSAGEAFQAAAGLPMGATGAALPQDLRRRLPAAPQSEPVYLLAVGGHMRGLPLNGQLTELKATFREVCRTAPEYRLVGLPGGEPPRPGLVRVSAREGLPIEGELWQLSTEALGRLMARIPSPLGIGTVRLEDGRQVLGFLCEAEATHEAQDISRYGGWRAYLASLE